MCNALVCNFIRYRVVRRELQLGCAGSEHPRVVFLRSRERLLGHLQVRHRERESSKLHRWRCGLLPEGDFRGGRQGLELDVRDDDDNGIQRFHTFNTDVKLLTYIVCS